MFIFSPLDKRYPQKNEGGKNDHNVFTFFHHKTTKRSLCSKWVITAMVLCLVSVSRKMSARRAQHHNYQPLSCLSTVANAAFKSCRKHCNYEFSSHNRPWRAVSRQRDFLLWNVTCKGAESSGAVSVCTKSSVLFHCIVILLHLMSALAPMHS